MAAGQSFGDKVFAVGADALADDYERRLAFSFGGDALASDAPPAARKKKRKRPRADSAAVVPSVEAPSAVKIDGASRKRQRMESAVVVPSVEIPSAAASRTKKHQRAAVETCGTALSARESDAPARSRKKRRASVTEHGAASENGGHVNAGSKLGRKESAKGKASAPIVGRFSKDLWKYRQAQEEKEAERQRKEDEIRALHRRRRNSAKDRAVKGQKLSQRNSRGQPRMSSILEMVTTKLSQQSRRRD